ncbi:MAG: hypothetical protein JST39_04090, partial [Bacteroidetes bacterium]|nr:hypothetical protein [Bacteroidota bacterium]
AARTLKKVRLTLGSANSVVFNGAVFPLTLNGNDNIVVIGLGELLSGDHMNWWLDFDAGSSIRQHGSSFELKPHVNAFRKENTAGIEGRVLPAEARAQVFAINGSDTASAKPGSEGEYKIIGLKSGTYALWIHATAAGYKDTTLPKVVVAAKEDTHLPAITLHK